MKNISLRGLVCFFTVILIINTSTAQTFNKQYAYQLSAHKLEKLKLKLENQSEIIANSIIKNEDTSLESRSGEEEVNISETEFPEAELHAAVNPTDTNNIIVAAMHYNPNVSFGESNVTFPIYYTHDFGETWQRSSFKGEVDVEGFLLSRGGGDPVITFDKDGTAYLSFLLIDIQITFSVDTHLHWAKSTDGGVTWELQAKPIAQSSTGGLLGGEADLALFDKEWIVADHTESIHQNNLYATYSQINLQDTTYQIFFNRKLPGNDTFEAPIILTSDTIVFAQFSSLDIDREGNVHVLFAAGGAYTEILGLYYVKSEDGGLTFSTERRIADVQVPFISPNQQDSTIVGIDPNRVYPCPHLRVDKSGGPYDGKIYVTWTGNGQATILPNGLDIYLTSSPDNGITWATPKIINDNALSYSDQFFSNISVNDMGILAISWYDRRNDPNNVFADYYFSSSSDGGTSFSENIRLSTTATDFQKVGLKNDNLGIGEYMQIVSTSHYAIPFWSDGRTGDGNLEIYMAKVKLEEGGLTTGITERKPLMNNLSISNIYPNPAKDHLNVTIQVKQATAAELIITDASGKVLRRHSLPSLIAGIQQVPLLVNEMPNGIYHCILNSQGHFVSKSFNISK